MLTKKSGMEFSLFEKNKCHITYFFIHTRRGIGASLVMVQTNVNQKRVNEVVKKSRNKVNYWLND